MGARQGSSRAAPQTVAQPLRPTARRRPRPGRTAPRVAPQNSYLYFTKAGRDRDCDDAADAGGRQKD